MSELLLDLTAVTMLWLGAVIMLLGPWFVRENRKINEKRDDDER
jgi:hypothetical protein